MIKLRVIDCSNGAPSPLLLLLRGNLQVEKVGEFLFIIELDILRGHCFNNRGEYIGFYPLDGEEVDANGYLDINNLKTEKMLFPTRDASFERRGPDKRRV